MDKDTKMDEKLNRWMKIEKWIKIHVCDKLKFVQSVLQFSKKVTEMKALDLLPFSV